MTIGIKTISDKIRQIKANREAYGKTHFKQVVYTPSEDDLKVAQACTNFIRKLDEAYETSKKSTLFFYTPPSKGRR